MLRTSTVLPVIDYDLYLQHQVRNDYRQLMARLEQAHNERKERERQERDEFNRTHCSYCRRPQIESRTLRLCSDCIDLD